MDDHHLADDPPADGEDDRGRTETQREDPMETAHHPGLDPERTTVHEAVGLSPGALDVLGRHGIDACCGGDLSLAEAARRHGVDLDLLLREMAAAATTGR